jgi:uncharacterized protein (DUF1697 family)
MVRDIAGKIRQHFGLEVPVVVRSLEELEQVYANNPFCEGSGRDHAKMHVTFLAGEPGTDRVLGISGPSFLPDEFAVKGKEVYLYCPDGYGRTKLNNPFFESKLKVTATTRNWKTVATLVEMGKEMVTG